MPRVLVVEDDPLLSSRMVQLLELERYQVEATDNGEDAISRLKVYSYDLIILDWVLPGCSGVEVLRAYRSMNGNAAVLMMTTKAEIQSKEEGLDSGADDYLPKPFHPREFSARVRALLRRQPQYSGDVLRLGEIILDKTAHLARVRGEEVRLLPLEFSLLEFFIRHPNQVFSKEALLERVWPPDSEASLEAVKTCLKSLRKKIDKNPEKPLIRNVHGVGYLIENAD